MRWRGCQLHGPLPPAERRVPGVGTPGRCPRLAAGAPATAGRGAPHPYRGGRATPPGVAYAPRRRARPAWRCHAWCQPGTTGRWRRADARHGLRTVRLQPHPVRRSHRPYAAAGPSATTAVAVQAAPAAHGCGARRPSGRTPRCGPGSGHPVAAPATGATPGHPGRCGPCGASRGAYVAGPAGRAPLGHRALRHACAPLARPLGSQPRWYQQHTGVGPGLGCPGLRPWRPGLASRRAAGPRGWAGPCTHGPAALAGATASP